MKRIASILILTALLSSCSPQKRFTRLVERHPELVLQLTDTLVLSDTLYIPEVSFDTVWASAQVDTLIMVDTVSNAIVQIIRVYDTLTVSVQVPADTVYITKEIPVSDVVAAPDCPPSRNWIIYVGIVIGFIVAVAMRLLLK